MQRIPSGRAVDSTFEFTYLVSGVIKWEIKEFGGQIRRFQLKVHVEYEFLCDQNDFGEMPNGLMAEELAVGLFFKPESG